MEFLEFTYGLVGGHCIGVDLFYLTYRAQQLGYYPQVILAGRRINDDMGQYIAENVVKQLIQMGKDVSKTQVAILGFTFKENCPDSRNTRVIDIVRERESYGLTPTIADPISNVDGVMQQYGVIITPLIKIRSVDCLIIAVAYKALHALDLGEVLLSNGLLIDIKGIFEPSKVKCVGYTFWRL